MPPLLYFKLLELRLCQVEDKLNIKIVRVPLSLKRELEELWPELDPDLFTSLNIIGSEELD